jgi:hypothetical protein
MANLHGCYRLADPGGFIFIHGKGGAVLNRTKTAVARADIAQKKKGGRSFSKTFALVGALGTFTDSMQVQAF